MTTVSTFTAARIVLYLTIAFGFAPALAAQQIKCLDGTVRPDCRDHGGRDPEDVRKEQEKLLTLTSAKKASLVAGSVRPKGQPRSVLKEDTEEILAAVGARTGLWRVLKPVNADSADIILQIDADYMTKTIVLRVRNADTNEVLYSEQRELILAPSDAVRLVRHFLKMYSTK